MDYSAFKDSPGFIGKGEPRKREKGRAKRTEAAIKKAIRAEVAERDQSCRFEGMAPADCYGPLQWCHLRPRTRGQTRGMAPEYRHTTAYTAMGCALHHGGYDHHKFDVVFLTDRMADGPIEVVRR